MSLESCPTCGYAVSTLGNHCRHCASSFSDGPSERPFNARYLPQIITATALLIACVYLIFFR
ncbi:hypothetical protein BH18VER2_BH18VER2_00100 [soil metagenome]